MRVESAVETQTNPAIAKLTPLAEVLALIDREVTPLAPRTVAVGDALHGTLAADVVTAARPAAPLALIDGWALAAEATRDAGGYAPAPLPQLPPRIDAGEPLPAGADCVAPLDAIVVSGNRAEALLPVNAGDGVLPKGGDGDAKAPWRRAGERLRAVDIAAFAASGIQQVGVRAPCLRIVSVRSDAILGNASRVIAADATRYGGAANESTGDLSAAFADRSADCIVTIGGTGSGRNDTSVSMLAREGRLAVHGVALTPGETAAFGFAGARPVLLLPGRLDAALAVWLVIGRRVLQRLTGATDDGPGETFALARKVASTVGFTELVPVRRSGDLVEPLAAKYLPWSALTRSDGWILVPAESEGYSAGAKVSIRPWP
jgi:molybdopterin biosynthesis enzyme